MGWLRYSGGSLSVQNQCDKLLGESQMEQITIPLTDPTMQQFVERAVSAGGFGRPGDYVLALIRADQDRRRRERIEALLLEGLEGDPSRLSTEDWEEMRRRYDDRNPGEG